MESAAKYSKAFVPLVVMLFALLGNRFGINFGIGEEQAAVLLGLVTSWLVFLIPNTGGKKEAVPTVVVQTPIVPIETPEVEKPSLIRTVNK